MALINTLNDIGNAIREKTGGTELIPLKEMSGAISGISSVPNPLEYATELKGLFLKAVVETEELVINAPRVTNLTDTFMQLSGAKKITLKGNIAGKSMSFSSTFRQMITVEEIDLTNFLVKPTNIGYLFYNSTLLKTIKGELDFSLITTAIKNSFLNCRALEEVRFKANSIKQSINLSSSTKLSTTSVQSIIDGLATVETAQTLTLHRSIVLTDEHKAQISSKNWTLVQ